MQEFKKIDPFKAKKNTGGERSDLGHFFMSKMRNSFIKNQSGLATNFIIGLNDS